ncbi:MAG: hypothetical protein A2V84_01225 [Chloroflexi bacterium RBG_16_70_13]|nr:MAG: hypothetical protein A2V84_01225 [Chloroflexi bacterium RBG_16_70_13]
MTTAVRRSAGTVAVALAVWALFVGIAGPAIASHVEATVTSVGEVSVGETVAIPVALHSRDGTPLAGTVVTFYLHMAFAGVEGDAEIGQAMTDELGVATLAYRPRLAGHHELRLEYVAAGDGEIESTSTIIEVTGGVRLVHSPAGVDVPGVGVELLMAVLATVWSILFWVVLRIVAIARAGGQAGDAGLEARR